MTLFERSIPQTPPDSNPQRDPKDFRSTHALPATAAPHLEAIAGAVAALDAQLIDAWVLASNPDGEVIHGLLMKLTEVQAAHRRLEFAFEAAARKLGGAR